MNAAMHLILLGELCCSQCCVSWCITPFLSKQQHPTAASNAAWGWQQDLELCLSPSTPCESHQHRAAVLTWSIAALPAFSALIPQGGHHTTSTYSISGGWRGKGRNDKRNRAISVLSSLFSFIRCPQNASDPSYHNCCSHNRTHSWSKGGQ